MVKEQIVFIILLIPIFVLGANTSIATAPTKNFYLENGEQLNSSMMKYLLYNTDFSVIPGNHSFTRMVGDYELAWTDDSYLIKIQKIHNKTYKSCLVMWFLRNHPEILAAFPEIHNKDSINTKHINGWSCDHTGGGNSNTEGGGGGGGAAVATIVADSKAHFWQLVRPNQEINLTHKDEGIAITQIQILNKNKELRNIELGIESLTQNPVSSEPNGDVYQYLRLTHKNIEAEDTNSIKLFFEINYEWAVNNLEDRDWKFDRIVLMRFNGTEWEELITNRVSLQSTTKFVSTTDEFSSYAIVGIPMYQTGGRGGLNIAEEEYNITLPEDFRVPSRAPIAWIVAFIVIVLGITLIVIYQKKKNEYQKKN